MIAVHALLSVSIAVLCCNILSDVISLCCCHTITLGRSCRKKGKARRNGYREVYNVYKDLRGEGEGDLRDITGIS